MGRKIKHTTAELIAIVRSYRIEAESPKFTVSDITRFANDNNINISHSTFRRNDDVMKMIENEKNRLKKRDYDKGIVCKPLDIKNLRTRSKDEIIAEIAEFDKNVQGKLKAADEALRDCAAIKSERDVLRAKELSFRAEEEDFKKEKDELLRKLKEVKNENKELIKILNRGKSETIMTVDTDISKPIEAVERMFKDE